MAIFHELDLVKFSELFSVNFDELRQWLHAKANALAQRGHKVLQPPSAANPRYAPGAKHLQPGQQAQRR